MQEGVWNKNISKGEKEAMKKAFSDKFDEIEKNPKLKKIEDFESASKEIIALSEEIKKLKNEIKKLQDDIELIVKNSNSNDYQETINITGLKFKKIGNIEGKIERLSEELWIAMMQGERINKIELKTIKSKLEQEIVNLEKEIQKLEKGEINSNFDKEFQEIRNLKQTKINEKEKKEKKLKKIEDYLIIGREKQN